MLNLFHIAGFNVAVLIDSQTGRELKSFAEYLSKNKWNNLIPSNFEQNTLEGLLNRKKWKSFFRDCLVMYPGMRWNALQQALEDPVFIPCLAPTSFDSVIKAAGALFSRFQGRHIGVQLSGGVDSSLVIGLLKANRIPYSLVGLSTQRYEFRTERHVQLKLANECGKVKLLDYEESLPLSGIETVQAHAWPDLSCINFKSDSSMAEACNELGIEVLFTGSGGDVILGTEVPKNPEDCNWHPQIFNYPWPKEVVYAKHGVELVSFFDDPQFINCIYNLRRGHSDDADKLWARRFFRDILPKELVDYTYRADFWGLYVDGLRQSLQTIRNLHKIAYELTGDAYFMNENLEKLFAEDLLQAKKVIYQKIESRAAMCAWINSLNISLN